MKKENPFREFSSGEAGEIARKISLAVVGTADTIEAASSNASSAIRSAIHKSGGATPGWDETVEVARSQAVFRFLEQTAVPV